jgi:peptidoglycan/xylan/chitin deacetylase (PgdA/CDA1 family)
MSHLPAAYIPRLFSSPPKRARDGLSVDVLDTLVERIADADVRSPALSSLIRGKLAGGDLRHAVLFVLGESRIEAIAAWAGALASSTYTSMVGCASSDIGRDGYLDTDDMPLLTGHGIALASQGISGRPLIGLPLEDLREELEQSRRRLSRLAGYQVRILLPAPSTLGNAVDGLVLEEARRAGYKLVLHPGRSVTDLSNPQHDIQPLTYRTLRTDDSPEHLHDWIVGKSLARSIAQVRDLVNRPRRILSRFGIEKE